MDKKWVVCRDFQLGHDFIVLYVVHMHAGCLTLADIVQHNKGYI